MPKPRKPSVMEFLFGVTHDELLACADSKDANDAAYMATLHALTQAWRDGHARRHLQAARVLANGGVYLPTLAIVPSRN